MTDKEYCDLSKELKISVVIEETNRSWKTISHMATLRSYPKGYVIEESGKNQKLYLIEAGYLCYSYYLSNGEKRILYYVGNGALFNEAHCMLNIADRVFFECMTDVKVYSFPSDILKDTNFVRTYPELYINLAQYIAFKRMHLGHFTSTIFKQKPITRISEILLQLYRSKSGIKINQSDIGSLLGLHQVTVARALAKLRTEMIIGKITKNNFEILDADRLAEFAK